MQKPTEQSMTNVKRHGRYFEETSTTCTVVRGTDIHCKLCTTGRVCDSDRAGCLNTRKSTTGMVLMRDAHCLKVSSTMELSCPGHWLRREIHACIFWHVVVRTDSSSGLAVGSRRGLGRLRYVQNSLLVGATASARGRPSVEEGVGRHGATR